MVLLRADSLQAIGRTDSARSLYETIHEADEGSLPALIGLGRVALAEHKWREALGFAEDGLEIDSASIACHFIAGIAESEIEVRVPWQSVHSNASRMHFEWILEHDSSFEDVLGQYALLERKNGERERALELARLQVAMRPDLATAHLGLFKLYRHYMMALDSAEFLGWIRNQPGSLPRFFAGETLRRNGHLAGAESVFAELLRDPAEVPVQAIRIARARLLVKRGEQDAAESEYWKAVAELKNELGASILFEDLKHVISEPELEYYRTLDSPLAQQDFFRSFWNFRNPSLALKVNLRLQEHIRRYVAAEERFEYTGPRTWFNDPDKYHVLKFPKAFDLNEEFNDIGVVYLRQGEPDDIERKSYGLFDEDDLAERIEPPRMAGSSERLSFALLVREIMDRYRRSDKGDYQSWLYLPSTESPRMIFHFQRKQSAGNNWRLTACPDYDPMIERLGRWDVRYQRIYYARDVVTMEVVESEVRDESRANVTHALTSDRHTWEKKTTVFRFPHAVDVFRAPDRRSLLDISYAIPVAALTEALPDSLHSVPVEIGFSLVDSKSHKTTSHLDTVTIPLREPKSGMIVDLIRYTVPPDSYKVAMHLRPLAGDMLGNWQQTLRVSDYSRPGFMMSSVQFLMPSSARVTMNIDGIKVVQSPFRTHVRTEPLYVYFQIYNLIPDGNGNTAYSTECRLLPRGETDWDEGIVVLKKQQDGNERMVAEFYSMDVRTVSPGTYKLVIHVTDRKRYETLIAAREIEILNP